ncbi:MAG: 4Fe-4S dicluster domain-containing protein [Candidatus Hydrothermarchaeales archaeon]
MNKKNYTKEMGEARLEFLEKISGKYFEEWLVDGTELLERFKDIPLLNKLTVNLMERYEKKLHSGQIIPIEEATKVLELVENPALLPCVCRELVGDESYTCLNFGLIPELYEKSNPNSSIEEISTNSAIRRLNKWNKEGLYQLILYYNAPYIATICNCSSLTCTAFKERHVMGTKTTMIKSEFVARINPTLCNGCKICLLRCQFGAIRYDFDREKAFIDIRECYGCGLCKTGCDQKAIDLIDRKFTPAKNLW